MFSNITPKCQRTRLLRKLLNNEIIIPIVIALIFPLIMLTVNGVKCIFGDGIFVATFNPEFWRNYFLCALVVIAMWWVSTIQSFITFFKLIKDYADKNSYKKTVIEKAEVLNGILFGCIEGFQIILDEVFSKRRSKILSVCDNDTGVIYHLLWKKTDGDNEKYRTLRELLNKIGGRLEIGYYNNSKLICDINILELPEKERQSKENKYIGLSDKERKVLIRNEKKKALKNRKKEFTGANRTRTLNDLKDKIKSTKEGLKYSAMFVFQIGVSGYLFLLLLLLLSHNTKLFIITVICLSILIVVLMLTLVVNDIVLLKQLQNQYDNLLEKDKESNK